MSNHRGGDNGESPEFSLTKAVEDVSQLGCAQIENLKERQKTLISLQATLSDVKKRGETAEEELRSKVREILIQEAEMEHLERQTNALHDRCASIRKENSELQIEISEKEQEAATSLEQFNAYRDKMRGHRAAVLQAASQTEAHKALEEKRALVRVLTQQKEQLRADLENPNGTTVQMAKREIDALKREIAVARTSTAEKREKLQREFEIHAQIKKDIEIQNRRYDAIVKRLRCQLSRAQAVHRQMSDDIRRMERQLAELTKQLEASQESG